MTPLVRRGIGVSPGIAIGPALLLERRISHVPKFDLAAEQVEAEIARLEAAVDRVRRQLVEIEEKADRELGPGVAQIIDAQRLMLDDRSFVERIRERIRKLGQNAEWAIQCVGDDLSERFARISDPYLRARANDLDDLAQRLLRALCGEEELRLEALDEPVVLFAYDLSPADTAILDRERVLGFATDVGGRTSHTAILARSLEIPAVVGLHDITDRVRAGATVVLDGGDGLVILDPSDAIVEEYRARAVSQRRRTRELTATRDLEPVTPDGVHVLLRANVESAAEAVRAVECGAAGIGLFRSEFLYLRRRDALPTEEEHLQEYRRALEIMAPEPVIVRTLDLGGEKELPGEFAPLRGADSLLGVRAIRHSLQRRDLFVTQLRGLLRAAPAGDLRILLPFITGLQEVREARRILECVRADLLAEGQQVPARVPLGAMLEVPAATLVVDHLAREVDFLAIGTNDLIQYLLAVDRNNDAVAYLYEPLHPAVLRLLHRVVQQAEAAGVPLSLCGETAADPLTAMVYLGLGIREMSMAPRSIAVIKNLIRTLPFSEARRIVDGALDLETAQEIEEFALGRLMAHFPDGFPVHRRG